MHVRPATNFAGLKPALDAEVRYRAERAGALLFHRRRLALHATNRTGLAILKRMNGKTSCAELLDFLQRRFPATSKRMLQRDLRAFLNTLAEADLLAFL